MSLAQTRRSRWWPAAGLAAAGLVVLAGCSSTASASGTTGESASTTGAATVASSDTQMDAFASCLAENGVTLPEPAGSPAGGADGSAPPEGAPPEGGAPGAGGTPPAPEGVDADTWAAALQACADVMPTPPEGGAPPAGEES
jgi:hypothetical protein